MISGKLSKVFEIQLFDNIEGYCGVWCYFHQHYLKGNYVYQILFNFLNIKGEQKNDPFFTGL